MAVSTFRTYLMYKASAGAEWAKLVDITSTPDLGGTPNMIETTTLSDDTQTFIPGVKQLGDGLEFSANYDVVSYTLLKSLEGSDLNYAIWKGGTGNSTTTAVPDGSDGKWSFTGQLTVFPTGGGVDEAFGMTINIAPSSAILFDSEASTDATLSALVINGVALSPAFDSATLTGYTGSTTADSNKVVAVANGAGASMVITVGAVEIANGGNATWANGSNTLTVAVTAADGETTKSYVATITKS